MSFLLSYKDVQPKNLKLASKLNSIYFIIPFLSAIYDYFNLGAIEMIGGFVMFMVAYILIWQLKNYNNNERIFTIVWLVLVILSILFIIMENITGNDGGIGMIARVGVSVMGLVVSIYFAFVLYILILDKDTVSAFKKSESLE